MFSAAILMVSEPPTSSRVTATRRDDALARADNVFRRRAFGPPQVAHEHRSALEPVVDAVAGPSYPLFGMRSELSPAVRWLEVERYRRVRQTWRSRLHLRHAHCRDPHRPRPQSRAERCCSNGLRCTRKGSQGAGYNSVHDVVAPAMSALRIRMARVDRLRCDSPHPCDERIEPPVYFAH